MKVSPANFTSYTWFVIILVLIGGLSAWILHLIFSLVGFDPPAWAEIPGAIGIAAYLYTLFDKSFWAWPVFRKVKLLDFPDLRGRWQGKIISSYQGKNTEYPAVLEIIQTASQIQINLYLEDSQSTSITASLDVAADGIDVLRYGYLNHPRPFSLDTMQKHYGSAELRYYPDIRKLEGEYFTSRERATHGTLSFEFERKTLFGRFEK